MSDPHPVVFDCNVFLQALARPLGPSGRCVDLALQGVVQLYVSPIVLDEVRRVTARPELIAKFTLRADRVQAMLDALVAKSIVVADVVESWTYARDPTDAHYVNLAAAVKARSIVSRDRDLLDLMDSTTADGKDFQQRFADLKVLDPVQFLREIGK